MLIEAPKELSEPGESDKDEAGSMVPTYQYVPVPSEEYLDLCHSTALSVVSRGNTFIY